MFRISVAIFVALLYAPSNHPCWHADIDVEILVGLQVSALARLSSQSSAPDLLHVQLSAEVVNYWSLGS